MQPGYNRPEYRADDNSHKQDENDLMKAVKQPKAQTHEDKDECGPHDSPKCPVSWWQRWISCIIFLNKQPE